MSSYMQIVRSLIVDIMATYLKCNANYSDKGVLLTMRPVITEPHEGKTRSTQGWPIRGSIMPTPTISLGRAILSKTKRRMRNLLVI